MCNMMASICIKKCNAIVSFSIKANNVTFFPDFNSKNDITRSQTTDVNMTTTSW